MTRGGNNLDYEKGFQIENKFIQDYQVLIKKVLGASKLEATTRSLVDVACGVDCYAQIQGDIYGVSVRYREKDYNSFTLTRHINDRNSEIHKWMRDRGQTIKPKFHVQVNRIDPTTVKVIRVNIDAFGFYLDTLLNRSLLDIQAGKKQLHQYYNSNLDAYEFRLTDEVLQEAGCIFVETYHFKL